MPATVTLELDYLHHTDKAVLVSDGTDNVWVPLSLVECDVDFDSLDRGDLVSITVPFWFAERERLI